MQDDLGGAAALQVEAAAAPGSKQQQQDEAGVASASTAGTPPLPYAVDGEGRKQPLPGSRSLFLRGGTLEALGLAGVSSKSGQLMAAVPRDKLLADIQFQGAISDFHPIKDAIKAADYDELLLLLNEDDAYGDGNNWEVAVTRAAADAWLAADAAVADAAAAAQAAAAQAAAEAAAAPRSKRKREPQPWQDQGSEAEMAAAGVLAASSSSSSSSGTSKAAAAGPAASGLLLSRPRRAFGAPVVLTDASAAELWASNTMEARPFRDANYDLRRCLQDSGSQAVPQLKDAAVQATGGRPRPAATQTAPQQLEQQQLEQAMQCEGFAAFLSAVQPRLEEALLQNSVADILADDLLLLADEEADGLAAAAATGAGSGGGGGSSGGRAGGAAGGAAGGRAGGAAGLNEHGGLSEAQTFTDLTYSKNRVVSAICWVPGRPGVVACAATDPASQSERLAGAGRLSPAFIMVWNFRDPIHPEYVLESPQEVFSFQYNPLNPDLVVGGCYNGQTIVWDTAGAELAKAGGGASGSGGRGSAAGGSRAGGGGGVWDDPGSEEAATPVIRHRYMSSVEHSHTSMVSDICWLPGVEVDRAGKVFAIRANSAGTSAQLLIRSMTLGAAALAAAAAGSSVPRECCFFASIAADGKVMFWDARVDKLLKKGNKRMDDTELVWRPMHVVHLLSVAANDFAGARFVFDPYRLDSGNFTAASQDGELLVGNFIRASGEDNPEYTRRVFAPHAGPVVALAPSPFLPELLLSVGDWSFRLWQGLDSQVPVFASPWAEEAYTAAAWSPTRPGLLFLATSAGALHIWDLLDRSHEPSLRVNAASSAITSIAFSNAAPKHATHSHLPSAGGGTAAAAVSAGQAGSAASSSGGAGPEVGHRHQGSSASSGSHQPAASGSGLSVLAVGDATGVLHLFELPRTLRRPLPNERRLMAAVIAQEAARVADVAARQPLRAAALKSLDESRKAAEDSPSTSSSSQSGAAAAGSTDGHAAAAAVAAAGSLSGGQPPAGTASASGGSQQGRTASVISLQAGTLAAAPAAANAVAMAPARRANVAAEADARSAAAEAAALAQAEKQYQALELEFKRQLGLVPRE